MDAAHDLEALAKRVEAAAGPDRRILDRLDRSGDCWLWIGALDARGRGRVWHRGKIQLHHRAVWQILIGPIPAGALLCHACDNPRCANPTHLYVGDDKSNVADMFGRGRAWQQREPERLRALSAANGRANNWARRAKNPKAKLTERQVEEIKSAQGSSYQIAPMYGVNPSTVQRIRSGRQWK